MGFRVQQLFDLATADTTARVLTGLSAAGLTLRDTAVRRAVRDLLRLRHRRAGWWCRWCAGYIPGTFFVLEALAGLGLRLGSPPGDGDRLMSAAHRSMASGVDFLLACQNEDGGWGETVLADLDDRQAGVGDSRPLYTAMSLIAVLACGHSAKSAAVERGVRWLVDAMAAPGRWNSGEPVFTLFARAWYYSYPLYELLMPLRALTAYLRALDGGGPARP
jgi:squalene-hopene/tetraprenyl-beta-curcumene cyclase